MHELALCRQLAAIVSRAVPGRRVLDVCVGVGGLRQVVPAALQTCWGAVTCGTLLADSTLTIDQIPVIIGCLDCGQLTRLGTQLCWQCSVCGSVRTEIRSGEEFHVTTVDVATS